MEKLYGYKQVDVINLIKMVDNRGEKSLSVIFREFALKYGKSAGTVRNLYYAMAKKSTISDEFRELLGGKSLTVSSPKGFSSCDEKELIKNILLLTSQGVSVRSAVLKLASGDAKLSLRYQNKYRSIKRTKPELIAQTLKELNLQEKNHENIPQIPEFLIAKLKKEINGLVDSVSLTIKKENAYLKKRILYLETENCKLSSLLKSRVAKNQVQDYFIRNVKNYSS